MYSPQIGQFFSFAYISVGYAVITTQSTLSSPGELRGPGEPLADAAVAEGRPPHPRERPPLAAAGRGRGRLVGPLRRRVPGVFQ